jgi:hypothetical protein
MNRSKTEKMKTKIADSMDSKKNIPKCNLDWKKNYEAYLNMTRKEHINWLAQPKGVPLKPYPDPALIQELPVKIEYHTLHGGVPSRIEYLARPKIRKSSPEPPALSYSIKGYSVKRMEELAKPKSLTGHIHARCMDTEEKSLRYFNPNRHYSKMTAFEAKKFREDWIERNSKPKVRVIDIPKRDERRLTLQQAKKLTERLTKVSDVKKERMAPKPFICPREPRPPGKRIVPMTMPWIDRLSKPRKLLPETILDMEYDPYVIRKSTLKAKPSK